MFLFFGFNEADAVCGKLSVALVNHTSQTPIGVLRTDCMH